MNWDDMRIFLAVARVGSVSGAARKLAVQHSTVSRRLQHLEDTMGVRLLDRKRSGYSLTAAGEELRDAAMRMEREMLRVDGSVAGRDADLTGNLTVTTVGNLAHSLLIPVLGRFSQLYPHITLRLRASNADVSLSEREADVAIRLTNSPPDTLIGKKIGTVASTVYASRDYLTRVRKTRESPRWIGVSCCGFHTRWTKALAGDETFNFIVDEPIITQASVREGLGFAVLPCHMGDQDAALVRYMAPPAEMDLDLWLLYHPDLKRTERVRVFREFVTGEFKKLRSLLEGTQERD